MNTPFPRNLAGSDLAVAANANLVTHMSWVQQRTPGMLMVSEQELVMVDFGLPCDTFNMIARARLTPDNLHQRIRAAVKYSRRSSARSRGGLTPATNPRIWVNI